MRAVLLAAGFGTRLLPLTRDVPKPLLEVGGRPVLSVLLERVVEAGVGGVVVVTNARFAGQIRCWAGTTPCPVPVEVVDDGAEDDATRLGAIADLRLALERVPPAEDVLVLAGDNLLEGSLVPYAEEFRRDRTPLILCRRVRGPVPPGRHGEVQVDARGRVTRFREKPADPESDLVATTLYFLPAGVAERLDAYLAEETRHDAPGHFVAWLSRRTPVRTAELEGRMFDIGDRDGLEAARREFREFRDPRGQG